MTKNHQRDDAAVTELCNAVFFLNLMSRKQNYGGAIYNSIWFSSSSSFLSIICTSRAIYLICTIQKGAEPDAVHSWPGENSPWQRSRS